MARQASCEERIDAELASRVADLRTLVRTANGGTDASSAELEALGVEVDGYDDDATAESAREALDNYALSVDTKTIMTVAISTGGPGDQFEVEIEDGRLAGPVTYRFLDWFDGATRSVNDDDVDAYLSSFAEIAAYSEV